MSKGVKFYDVGETTIVKKTGNFGDDNILTFSRTQPNRRAIMAATLVEKWGMVAAIEDGVDGQGRAKMRLMTPDEVVVRACQTADLFLDKISALGWMETGPSAEELYGLPGEED